MSKFGISKELFKIFFEKQSIAKKIENVMAFANENLPEETYKSWKTENTVTAEVQWESITFKQPIFSLEDLY